MSFSSKFDISSNDQKADDRSGLIKSTKFMHSSPLTQLPKLRHSFACWRIILLLLRLRDFGWAAESRNELRKTRCWKRRSPTQSIAHSWNNEQLSRIFRIFSRLKASLNMSSRKIVFVWTGKVISKLNIISDFLGRPNLFRIIRLLLSPTSVTSV